MTLPGNRGSLSPPRGGVEAMAMFDTLIRNPERLSADATGVRSVWVKRPEIVSDDAHTGELPGTLLKSGRDTRSVEIPSAPAAG